MCSRGKLLVELALKKGLQEADDVVTDNTSPSNSMHFMIQGNNITEKLPNPDNVIQLQCDESDDFEDFDDDARDPDWDPTQAAAHKRGISLSTDSEDNEEAIKDKHESRTNIRELEGSLCLKIKNKKLRMHGMKYMGVKKDDKGVKTYCAERAERIMAPSGCSKRCEKHRLRKCSSMDENTRSATFTSFWRTMDWKQKKIYVLSLVEKSDVVQRTTGKKSRRNFSYQYFLWKGTERLNVCKNMFLSTVGISEKTVSNWINSSNCGLPKAIETLGTEGNARQNHRMIQLSSARDFLEKLPKVPSHYCRASSTKQYLEPLFTSLNELYREYIRVSEADGKSPYHRTGFKQLFQDMNLSLWHPKKDQCDLCCSYQTNNISEDEYQAHIKRKTEARESKRVDKEKAIVDRSEKVITLDLESLLVCPKFEASSLYYKMKLSCHNFTVYDLASGDVMCYFWHEGEGELTANCFASCVIDYLNTLNLSEVKKVTIYSDGCTYQNRNATLSNALLLFSMKNNITIEHKYLERGHTQMECDSIHSCIERKIKHKSVFIPQHYVDAIKSARLRPPYKIKYLDHTFFSDYSALSFYPSIRPGQGVGSSVVTDIRILKYLPEGKIQFKTNYSDDNYNDLPKPRSTRTSTDDAVSSLYHSKLPIKKTKYEHLQKLKEVMPRDYHSFYDTLVHT